MGRQGNVEHATASKIKNIKEMPQGVSNALQAVKEMNEEEMAPVVVKERVQAPAELRDLVLFGRVVDEVSIGGYSIKISTLTNRQQKAVLTRLLKLTGDDRIMSVKAYTLAEALVSINGVDLIDLYDGNEELSNDEKKIDVILNLQSSLVEKLFDKYESMVVKSNKIFEEGDLAEEIKN